MPSRLRKRSVEIDGRQTSVSLEQEYWDGLREIADRNGSTITALVREIDSHRGGTNLAVALRAFIIRHGHKA